MLSIGILFLCIWVLPDRNWIGSYIQVHFIDVNVATPLGRESKQVVVDALYLCAMLCAKYFCAPNAIVVSIFLQISGTSQDVRGQQRESENLMDIWTVHIRYFWPPTPTATSFWCDMLRGRFRLWASAQPKRQAHADSATWDSCLMLSSHSLQHRPVGNMVLLDLIGLWWIMMNLRCHILSLWVVMNVMNLQDPLGFYCTPPTAVEESTGT